MTSIENPLDSRTDSLINSTVWLSTEGGLLTRIAAEIAQRGLHPSRVVVLLPYGQLLALVNRLWAQAWPDGFSPRFETTKNWALALGAEAGTLSPAQHNDVLGDDYRFDAALDSLTARSLLERTGFTNTDNDTDVDLMPRLLQACGPMAGRAAAVPPSERLTWAAGVRVALDELNTTNAPPVQALRMESAVTRVALVWASSSSYATDVLWASGEGASLKLMSNVDCLIVLKGFQDDPLSEALAAQFGDKAVHMPLVATAPQGAINTHAALDFEEEALWAAACVLRHVETRELASSEDSGDKLPPIAFIATDRTLTRRVRAMLETHGLSIRDETGWTLSTTRAAATLMTQLQACGWQASSDAVLDWLKNSPAFPEPLVGRLENLLRQARCTLWRDRDMSVLSVLARKTAKFSTEDEVAPPDELIAFVQGLQQQLALMQSPRPLRQWWVDVVTHLQISGVWPLMQQESAAKELITALHLSDAAQTALRDWPLASRRMRLDEFIAWVRHALEASSYLPPSVGDSHVVILPLSQLLARPFYAVVLPACDEVRLSPSPELPGSWTGPERIALGLPTREEGAAMLRAAWQQALQCQRVDLLYRKTDSGGETLLPSPLLQLHLLAQPSGHAMNKVAIHEDEDRTPGLNALNHRAITAAPTLQPRPRGQTVPVTRLSASAYEDLRHCPYRFFALRQLGLKEASELDSELEKRDFGDWLHEVLKDFHQAMALPANLPADLPTRRTLLDQCAEAVSERRKFSAGEFLPYQAAWPRLRDGYLDWLAEFEATGAHFVSAETWHEMGLGPITLIGRIDRIDASASTQDAPAFLLDYKTESPIKTKERLKNPLEDTQIAFYAALLPDDSLRAAYLNLNEKDGTQLIEQADVVDTRDTLITGILDDMQRIANGAVLAALGEGVACDYCAARGLCRKDFWEQTV